MTPTTAEQTTAAQATADQATQEQTGAPSTLASRVADVQSDNPDTILEAFLDWVGDLGFDLYPAQEEALLEIMAGQHVILNTPTGSGKSLVATAMHFRAFCEGKRAFYTAPIKALVSEKFFELCRVFGAENVGMMTGDATINRDASIVCCTAEVLSNMALRQGKSCGADYIVMDEFHYYSDRDRGIAWQIPLVLLPQSVFLLMSATLGDVRTIAERLEQRSHRAVATVTSAERPVPLSFEYRDTPLLETIGDLVKREKAPIYMVNFTQRDCAEEAQKLMSSNFSSKDDKRRIAAIIKNHRFDSVYGKDVRRFVSHGIGLHHAGLLPKYRLLVEKLAQEGLLKVISGTDTLGVGVNVPIRTVLFTKLCKYDGEKVGILSVRNFKQISGRAGRKGFDDSGLVACQAPEHVIENRRLAQKAKNTGKKKYSKKQPPKFFVSWNEDTFRKLAADPPEPLESRFDINYGLMLNMLKRNPKQQDGGYRNLLRLVTHAHITEAAQSHYRKRAAQLFKALRKAGLVELTREIWARGPVVRIPEDLQRDFSLNQSLSLYLVSTLAKLDRELESYAVDVLSLVEAVLENPRVILRAHESKVRGDKIGELKMEGVPYEERMEAIEDLSYPRPNEQFIYDTFNDFVEDHPWLRAENIRPKGVIAEIWSGYYSFAEFIREFRLARSEGAVLRYISDAYKALAQTVPEEYLDENLHNLIAYLRAIVTQVDSSLIEEWEGMRQLSPDDVSDEVEAREFDITLDLRSFNARIRAELHQIVRALSEKNWEGAVHLVSVPRDEAELPWTPERFEQAMAPYFESYKRLYFNHEARLTEHTTISKTGQRVWEVSQRLLDEEADNFWAIEGVIDLSDRLTEPGPLISLVRLQP